MIGDCGLLSGKTRILATHALTQLRHVYKIVLLDGTNRLLSKPSEGRIIETGTYEELLKANGRFAQLLKEFATERLNSQKSKEEEEKDEEEDDELENVLTDLASTGSNELAQLVQRSRSRRVSSSRSVERQVGAMDSIFSRSHSRRFFITTHQRTTMFSRSRWSGS